MDRLSLRPLVIANVVLGAVLFVLAWAFADAEHGVGAVLGAIGWFGLWLCVLALLVLGVVWIVRRVRRPATA